MSTRVTSRDIQEIVSKLSSDKAKSRDEGIKLLNTWLEGERSVGFCRYLSEKSSMIKPNEIPHSETWPFLVKILIQCLSLEISSSKKRSPKLNFAKTLRIVVQRAEDGRSSAWDPAYAKNFDQELVTGSTMVRTQWGKNLPLLPVARLLFSHVWDVLKDVPIFQSEYGVILRHLLSVKDYRFHMRRRVYCNLVLLYMEKVETSLTVDNIGQLNPKEEVFRFTLTLQSLLENPPGDIPDELREDMIKGFVGIFSHVRDEGKIARKLVECINVYLSKDGPNLGCKSLEIHEAVQQFVFRCWFATHDRTLKDALVCYSKLQLSLTRGVVDGTALLEQLLDVVSKELDQMSTYSPSIPRSDSTRDVKCGLLTSSQLSIVELAALVFCRALINFVECTGTLSATACTNTPKTPTEKRARREDVVVLIKERLMEGKWSWHSALCCLIRYYSTRVKKDLFISWFLSISTNFESCLRALQEGEFDEFHTTLKKSKQALLMSICHASKESTEYIYSTIVKLQIFYHLGMAWGLRWSSPCENFDSSSDRQKLLYEPVVPSSDRLQLLHTNWSCILKQTDLHMNLLEPFIAFRRVLLRVLNSMDSTVHHLWESASVLRKGSRISQAAAALHEFKFLCSGMGEGYSNLYWLGRLEEAKLLRAQGQHEMAINLADYISQNHCLKEEAADVFRLVGKWLAETRSSNSRTILEKYLKQAVNLAEDCKATDKLSIQKRNQMHFHLAHYADALFRSHEERLSSNEWQVAMRLRKHKGDKTDYSLKIQELQKQLAMDRDEEVKLQEDRDNFLCTALEGYKRCLVIGEKYDIRVVFRLVSLWFSLSTRQIIVDSMLSIIKEVQSHKFILLVYQIASRMGGAKDSFGPTSFQFALLSLVKKMALDHPYHTIFQLLALANGDRIKDKQRSRNSFVVDVDKKIAAEDLLRELSSYHGAIIRQMKQMVEIYIKLAEMETKREDTNKRVTLPRELRSVRQLELVPVITSNFPVDRTCQYPEGSFPHFKGLGDSVTIMNGINAPKVVECLGSDGKRYRQLAKSGNDDLRQDAVMEQFFGLVNTFLQNNRDTWRRRLRIRTYKVVPFTPSAGVLEWVNGTFPLGEYLIGSSRNGGAHGRYGVGDWTFMECRQHMTTETNKRKAFQEVCDNFRPVMHHFFLERFSDPADWFDKRLAYTRSVAASSMVGYIVGLGDRHSMNILIDQATAEVVHIDLGVAFEQGLMLKTPERVPFRLTRDIIDGMGVTGVEGVFRRCCEETLSVMRTNKEALLTIIEVFIHDPLYKWALSPLKAMQRQKDIDDDLDASLEDSDEDEYEGNKDAARALLRVKQKLDGYEDGEMRSVHGQVQQLIQDAIDPDRLCHMFPGWGAWL
ncbi:UNVERIFIED_CONTAM: Serine/threonine-protein kinase ATM [Sesamum indicum]